MRWNYICDRCGFKFFNDYSKLEWTGLRVCPPCYDKRNAQEFVRGKADRQAPPWVRPEPTDVSRISTAVAGKGALILEVQPSSPSGYDLGRRHSAWHGE
jgi:DNA-directed RNA polymerase subunit RPC12/RpoP